MLKEKGGKENLLPLFSTERVKPLIFHLWFTNRTR